VRHQPALDRELPRDGLRPCGEDHDLITLLQMLEPAQNPRNRVPLDHIRRAVVLTEVNDPVEVDADRESHARNTGLPVRVSTSVLPRHRNGFNLVAYKLSAEKLVSYGVLYRSGKCWPGLHPLPPVAFQYPRMS